MKIQNASQAKKILEERAAQMAEAFTTGVQNMSNLAKKGRKIIEIESNKATSSAAEAMLNDM